MTTTPCTTERTYTQAEVPAIRRRDRTPQPRLSSDPLFQAACRPGSPIAPLAARWRRRQTAFGVRGHVNRLVFPPRSRGQAVAEARGVVIAVARSILQPTRQPFDLRRFVGTPAHTADFSTRAIPSDIPEATFIGHDHRVRALAFPLVVLYGPKPQGFEVSAICERCIRTQVRHRLIQSIGHLLLRFE